MLPANDFPLPKLLALGLSPAHKINYSIPRVSTLRWDESNTRISFVPRTNLTYQMAIYANRLIKVKNFLPQYLDVTCNPWLHIVVIIAPHAAASRGDPGPP